MREWINKSGCDVQGRFYVGGVMDGQEPTGGESHDECFLHRKEADSMTEKGLPSGS
jgi:hypothetical protein